MRKHLVWDWNGTLLNDFPVIVEATNYAISSINGTLMSPDEHRDRFYRPIIDFYSELAGRKLTEADFDTLNRLFHEHYLTRVTDCPLTVGAREAMAAWQGSQSLLSMWFHDELVPLVTTHGLVESFARVDGLRDITATHSKHPHLEAHLVALGVSAADCVLIGDTVDDALAARATGADCVLYAGGFTSPSKLRETGAVVAESLSEAIEIAART